MADLLSKYAFNVTQFKWCLALPKFCKVAHSNDVIGRDFLIGFLNLLFCLVLFFILVVSPFGFSSSRF